jgi:Concanavalin A-like lectin/glucanases superfamily
MYARTRQLVFVALGVLAVVCASMGLRRVIDVKSQQQHIGLSVAPVYPIATLDGSLASAGGGVVVVDPSGNAAAVLFSDANAGQVFGLNDAGQPGFSTQSSSVTRGTSQDLNSQIVWEMDEEGGVTTVANSGVGPALPLTGLTTPCSNNHTGVFYNSVVCANNSSTPGAGLDTVSTSIGENDAGVGESWGGWFRPIALGSAFNIILIKAYFDGGAQTTPFNAFGLQQTASPGFTQCNVTIAGTNYAAGPTISGTPNGVLTVSADWYYIVCVWNGALLTEYINGDNVGTVSPPADGGTHIDFGTHGPYSVMHSAESAAASASNGGADRFFVYTEALNQGQIRQQYQYGLLTNAPVLQ